MTFSREITDEDSFKILDHFVEVGGNFIDELLAIAKETEKMPAQ